MTNILPFNIQVVEPLILNLLDVDSLKNLSKTNKYYQKIIHKKLEKLYIFYSKELEVQTKKNQIKNDQIELQRINDRYTVKVYLMNSNSSSDNDKKKKYHEYNLLERAAMSESMDVFLYILNKNQKTKTKPTDIQMTECLQIAAKYKSESIDIIKYIFKNYNCIDINKAFENACKTGNLEIAKFLLNTKKLTINDAFSKACRNGHLQLIQFLLDQNIKFDYYALIAAGYGNHFNILKYLMNISSNELDFEKILTYISSTNNLEIIIFLLDHCNKNNITINIIDIVRSVKYLRVFKYFWNSSLISKRNSDQYVLYACYNDSIEIIEFLYQEDKNINFSMNSDIIEFLCEKGFVEIIKFILKKIPSGHNIEKYLINACKYNHTKLIKFLIKLLNIKQRQKMLIIILKHMSSYKNLEFIKFLEMKYYAEIL